MVEFRVISICVAKTIAIVANIILIILVIKRTEKLLSPYKRILMIQISIDLILSIDTLLFQFKAYQTSGIYFAVMDSFSLGTFSPSQITIPSIGFITFFVYAQVSILPLHYIYRYLIICHNKFLNYIQILIICFVCFIPPGLLAGNLMIQFWPSSEAYANFATILMATNESFIIDGNLPVFYAFEISKVTKTAPIPLVTYFLVYSTTVFCTVAIIRNLKKFQSNISASTSKNYQTQTQFNKILFVQAGVPFITNVIPLFLNTLSTTFNMGFLSYTTLFVWFITVWASAINPIFTISVMKCYRRAVVKFFTGTESKIPSILPKTSQNNRLMLSTVN